MVGRGRHPERREDPVADEVAVLLPAGRRDDPPEDPVAEVRVLERGPGRPGERRTRRQEPLERVKRQALLPVAPRIVGREPGRHRQEVADRDRRRVGRWWCPAGQRGHVQAHRVVEPEATLVAQQEDGRRRERLGHRRDPVDRVGVGPAVLAVADGARPRRVHEPAVAHDPPRDARDLRLAGEALEPPVDRRQQVVERAHPASSPIAAAFPCRSSLQGDGRGVTPRASWRTRVQRARRSRSRPGQVCRRPSRSTKPNTGPRVGDAIGWASGCPVAAGPGPQLGGDLGVHRRSASGGEHGPAFARIRVRGRRLGGQDEEGAAQ